MFDVRMGKCEVRRVATSPFELRSGSSGRTRTYNPPVNSRMLCQIELLRSTVGKAWKYSGCRLIRSRRVPVFRPWNVERENVEQHPGKSQIFQDEIRHHPAHVVDLLGIPDTVA